jgi:hypothetical protein
MHRLLVAGGLAVWMAAGGVDAGAADTRCYEMRVYYAAPGKLDALNARFRDHTLGLFKKHRNGNFAYWTPATGEKGADTMLVYLVTHASREAAKASFDGFRQDPAWLAARKESEDKTGGSLTVADGVKSEFLVGTDYSPTR